MYHPGYTNNDQVETDNYAKDCEQELAVLVDPRVMKKIQKK